MSLNKRQVVERIQEYLTEELKTVETSAEAARRAATDEDNRPENEYDTRAVEAGYLAGAQAKRAEELRGQLLMYKHMPLREYGDQDVACAGALVELELNRRRAFYFIAPTGGGLVTTIDGHAVQVITPASPLGEALLGRRVGETVEVESRDSVRAYKVLSIR